MKVGGRKMSEKRKKNKQKHAEEGNKTSYHNIDSWNSDQTQLINQINEVKALIQERRPHALISEKANFWAWHRKEDIQCEGYKVHTTKMLENKCRQCSRLVIYVKDEIRVKRRKELELDDFSAIWMEIGLPHAKKMLLGGVYREHSHLKLDKNHPEITSLRQHQEERWTGFVEKWEEAINLKEEVIVLGDINIDLKDENNMTDSHKIMFDEVKTKIISAGTQQLITGCTRFSSTCSPSLIDHVYSTHPEHTKTENLPWGTSDHNLIGVKRENGIVVEKERIIRKRVFKDFNRMSFNRDLEFTDWLELLNINDIDACVEQFDSKLLRVLEKHCPIRKIQVRKNYTPWYNEEIKAVKTSLK